MRCDYAEIEWGNIEKVIIFIEHKVSRAYVSTEDVLFCRSLFPYFGSDRYVYALTNNSIKPHVDIVHCRRMFFGGNFPEQRCEQDTRLIFRRVLSRLGHSSHICQLRRLNSNGAILTLSPCSQFDLYPTPIEFMWLFRLSGSGLRKPIDFLCDEGAPNQARLCSDCR